MQVRLCSLIQFCQRKRLCWSSAERRGEIDRSVWRQRSRTSLRWPQLHPWVGRSSTFTHTMVTTNTTMVTAKQSKGALWHHTTLPRRGCWNRLFIRYVCFCYRIRGCLTLNVLCRCRKNKIFSVLGKICNICSNKANAHPQVWIEKSCAFCTTYLLLTLNQLNITAAKLSQFFNGPATLASTWKYSTSEIPVLSRPCVTTESMLKTAL